MEALIQSAVSAAMRQQTQEMEQLKAQISAKDAELAMLAGKLQSLEVKNDKTKTQAVTNKSTQKSPVNKTGSHKSQPRISGGSKSKESPNATISTVNNGKRKTSLTQKTPTKSSAQRDLATPPSETPKTCIVNKMRMDHVPESFLKTREAFYVHIKILWGLIEELAIPKPPDHQTLHEFHARFSCANDIEMAAENTEGPRLIPEHEIQTIKSLTKGGKRIGRKFINVEEFFFIYIKATLARLGIRVWAPDLDDAPDSLYNEACRVTAVKTFRQVSINGAYSFLGCNVEYLNDIGILVQSYNHYVHYVQTKRYSREKKNVGALREEAERKVISKARERLRNSRVRFATDQKFPKRYLEILESLDAHSDDEYNSSKKCYIIKTLAFRSTQANIFFRRLDSVMEKAATMGGRRNQRRVRVLPSVPEPSIFGKPPKGLPIDFYDPEWFNDLLPVQRLDAADIWKVAFLPNPAKSLLGKRDPDERLTNKKFIEKHWESLTKPYDLSHEIHNNEEEDSSDDGEDLADTSGEESPEAEENEEDADFIDNNESNDEDYPPATYEELMNNEAEDEERDARYQMLIDEDNMWS